MDARNETSPDRSDLRIRQFALRVVNTVRYLKRTAEYLRALGNTSSANTEAARAVRLSTEVENLTKNLLKQKERHATEIRQLQITHADQFKHPGDGSAASGNISAFKAEIAHLKAENKDLLDRYGKSLTDADTAQKQVPLGEETIQDLREQIAGSQTFSPAALSDFLRANVTFNGH
ncbi:hypothetical protein BBJ29_009159 [Phytophthora kernoviae]|uniref:Uncharacterized protein n=1 Tax=Phytophthora kernoviae TaxID=325452 RepID=A0A3F2RCJ6_9STRA|nr:hypothetical protein BBP00_00009495 [Phytophthora kernoviae]RLN61467.1 hypothetical protein BBJ29_009159 [Phytophthora kernoviae]